MLQVNSTITSPSTRTTDYLLIRTENRIYFFMNWRKVSLFLSGLFLGGAIDHVILALMKSPLTPYGVNVGVTGNWGSACLICSWQLSCTCCTVISSLRVHGELSDTRGGR
jgi:hypothetical protein